MTAGIAAGASVRSLALPFLAIGLAIVVYVSGAAVATPLVVTPIGSDALERLTTGEGDAET